MHKQKSFVLLAAIMVLLPLAVFALEVEIDGEKFFGAKVIVREEAQQPDPPKEKEPWPPVQDCSNNLDLNVTELRRGQNRHVMGDGEIMAFRFNQNTVARNIQFAETTDGLSRRKHITVSDCAGDYRMHMLPPRCSRVGTSGTMWLQFGADESRRGEFACTLPDDNRNYFINVRYFDPAIGRGTCGAGGVCGFLVTN